MTVPDPHRNIPAPYELVEADDLGAAVAAALTVSCGGITAWILGHWSYGMLEAFVRYERASNWRLSPPDEVIVAAGWAVGTIFLAIGALLLLLRRGRKMLVFGALIAGATTVLASSKLGFNGQLIEQWPLYWGGVAVFVLGLLPATGRWARRPAKPGGPAITPTGGGPILYPGL